MQRTLREIRKVLWPRVLTQIPCSHLLCLLMTLSGLPLFCFMCPVFPDGLPRFKKVLLLSLLFLILSAPRPQRGCQTILLVSTSKARGSHVFRCRIALSMPVKETLKKAGCRDLQRSNGVSTSALKHSLKGSFHFPSLMVPPSPAQER